MDRKLVLASRSPRRQALLSGIGCSFEVLAGDVDETYDPSWSPGRIVTALALRKARWAARRKPDAVVIGADTLVVADRRIMGKPRTPEEARSMLSELQGRAHTVYTGVAVIDARSGREAAGFRATEVRMRSLSEAEVEAYVATGEPMDKAGAYAIQGLGALLVDSIAGDYFTVVGLPLTLLDELLREFGLTLFPVR